MKRDFAKFWPLAAKVLMFSPAQDASRASLEDTVVANIAEMGGGLHACVCLHLSATIVCCHERSGFSLLQASWDMGGSSV